MKINLIARTLFLFCCCSLYAFQCHFGGPDRLSTSRSLRTQNIDSDRPNEPGKCYAKCLMPDQQKSVTIDSIAMFTGKDSSGIMFAERVIQEELKGTKWVKKKADRNCLSADPDDCLVWCLVENNTPEVKVKYLADTSQTDEWEYQDYTVDVITQSGGYSEWQEVICEKDIDELFYTDLKNALQLRGYATDTETNDFSAIDKKALIKFQEDNGMPIGQLDLITLSTLGLYAN